MRNAARGKRCSGFERKRETMFFAALKLDTAKRLPAVNRTVMTAFETLANASGTVVVVRGDLLGVRDGFRNYLITA